MHLICIFWPICRFFVRKLQVGVNVKYSNEVAITEAGKHVL